MRKTQTEPRAARARGTGRRGRPVLAALAIALAVLIAWRLDGGDPHAPPAARAAMLDSPTNLAVDGAGDVWVTMSTDTGQVGVDRYSSGLAWRGGFMALGDIHDLAGAVDGGGVFMDLSIAIPDQPDLPSLNLISHLDAALKQDVAWDLGLSEVEYVRSIAVETDGTVDVLIAGDAGYTEIRRFSPAGSALDRMVIDPWALDIAVGADGIRYVVYDDPDNPRVMRYSLDGGLAGSWKLPAIPSGIARAPDGRLFVPVHEGIGANSRVERFKPDGSSDGGFKVTGRAWRLAAGQDGSLYAVIEVPPRWSLQRFSATGSPRDTVDWEQMQRRRAAHPATVTALPPPPSATASPTATQTATITPTRRPATRTPSPTTSPTPGGSPGVSATPTPPVEPSPTPTGGTGGARIFLPAARR